MILEKLNILNYRNIAEAEMKFSPKINCFVGSNGEGKTNVLDAIYFLSLTKSMANSIDSMNVRHGEEYMLVQGNYDLNGIEEEVTIGMKLHQKKQIKRNQKPYKRVADHIGLLPLIIVSPNDSTLIAGGSEERRRFMDIVISQYDSEYMTALMAYNKAMQQRNAMLKEEEENINIEILSVFEEMMAESGELIYQKRKQFIDEFIPVFQNFYGKISEGNETVNLQYTSHCQRGALIDVIQKDRRKDILMGYSLHGIHKDDLEMDLGGFPIKREGSQGQNKTYLISLKLAQFDFLKRTGSKTTPLLLLDDIFDKLDAHRVEQIVNLVAEDAFGQIFITDTNRENLDRILERSKGDYKIFHVENGEISLM